jgi:hypothetical protein
VTEAVNSHKMETVDQDKRLRELEKFVAGQAELNKNIERMLAHLNKE